MRMFHPSATSRALSHATKIQVSSQDDVVNLTRSGMLGCGILAIGLWWRRRRGGQESSRNPHYAWVRYGVKLTVAVFGQINIGPM